MTEKQNLEAFEKRVRLPVAPAEAFAWHARPGALQRLQPPWERIEVVEQSGGIRDGARVVLRARVGPWWTTWRMTHEAFAEGVQFADRMEDGPFAYWRHEHRFEPAGEETELIDRIAFRLPLHALTRLVAGRFVARKLERLFCYRHAVTSRDLETWRRLRHVPRMKVLVTGATGLVGSALVPYLTTQGHEVVRLSRSGAPGMFRWEPESGRIEAAALEGVDAIVNLAGANIAEGRWTSKRRRLILESRLQSTRALVEAMATMEKPPSVFVNASAVGIYGDTGDREVDESAGVGRGFLAEVCRRWEAEARRAEALGVRTVLPRLGVVLTPSGGALAKLLPLFRSGLGGPVGGGRQWMSWIAMDDLLEVLLRLLTDRSMTGPVNAVAPTPVTNGEFARTLARVLGRPSVVPTPATALRLAFGQMATETMLASSRVKPARLLEAGHAFRHGELEPALRHLLGRERSC